MAGFLEKLKAIGKSGVEDYSEVDFGQFEEMSESAEITLRVADLGKIEVLPEIKQEIYAGNIVLVDIAGLKRDKAALDRAIGELKKAVEDVSGVSPALETICWCWCQMVIRIDREKVVGSKN